MDWFWDVLSIVVIVVTCWYLIQEARYANSLGRLYVAIPATFAFGGPRRTEEEGGDKPSDGAGRGGQSGAGAGLEDVVAKEGWKLERPSSADDDESDRAADQTEGARSWFDALGLESLVQLIRQPPAADTTEATVSTEHHMEIDPQEAVEIDAARPEGRWGGVWTPRADDTSHYGVAGAERSSHGQADSEGGVAADLEPGEFDKALNPDPYEVPAERQDDGNSWLFGKREVYSEELEPWYNDPTDPRSPFYEAWRDDLGDPRNPDYRED